MFKNVNRNVRCTQVNWQTVPHSWTIDGETTISIILKAANSEFHHPVGMFEEKLAYFLNSSWSKTPNCHWNFDAIYHSSRDISTSGLGGHITIVVVAITFFKLDLVETPDIPLERNTFAVLLKLVGLFYPKRNSSA